MTKAIRKLDSKQVTEIRATFRQFDVDGSGSIDAKELGAMMRSLGLNPTEGQLRAMVNEADTNKNGTIDLDEFIDIMEKMSGSTADTKNALKNAFKVFDKDGDGFITADELFHILTNKGDKMSREQANEMLHIVDQDGDGKINYEEFVAMMTGDD